MDDETKIASESLLKQPLPSHVADEGIELWKMVLAKSERSVFVSESYATLGCADQSLLAGNRCTHLQKLYKYNCPEWGTLNILTECIFL
jgi:hypothetical protein